jgi:hypothetical protein
MDALKSIMIQIMERAQVILDSDCAEAVYGTYILLIVFHRRGLKGLCFVVGLLQSNIFNS